MAAYPNKLILVVSDHVYYCKSLIFGGYVILAIFAVKAKRAKIEVRQYFMQLNEAQTDEYFFLI